MPVSRFDSRGLFDPNWIANEGASLPEIRFANGADRRCNCPECRGVRERLANDGRFIVGSGRIVMPVSLTNVAGPADGRKSAGVFA